MLTCVCAVCNYGVSASILFVCLCVCQSCIFTQARGRSPWRHFFRPCHSTRMTKQKNKKLCNLRRSILLLDDTLISLSRRVTGLKTTCNMQARLCWVIKDLTNVGWDTQLGVSTHDVCMCSMICLRMSVAGARFLSSLEDEMDRFDTIRRCFVKCSGFHTLEDSLHWMKQLDHDDSWDEHWWPSIRCS